VVGLHNRGASDLNVTTLQGSLNSVQNFAMYFQNFTEQVRGGPRRRRRGPLWRAGEWGERCEPRCGCQRACVRRCGCP